MESTQNKRKTITFALIGNPSALQQWQVNVLNKLLELDYVQPVLLLSPHYSSESKKSFLDKLFSRKLFFQIRNKFFRHPLQQPVSLPETLKTVKVHTVNVKLKGKHSEYFDDATIELLKQISPDFILRFGMNIIRGEALNCAKYGIWSYHHGDPESFRGGPPCFWEVFKNTKTHGAILQRLTNTLDSGIVLKQGCFSVTNHSWRETLNACYNHTDSWVKQVCIDINNGTANYIDSTPISSEAKIYTYPGNFTMMGFAIKILFRKLTFHFKRIFKAEIWKIHTGEIDEKNGINFESIKGHSHTKKNAYLADPFFIEENGETKIICENYSYKNRKGKISVMNLNGKIEYDLTDSTTHYSYPFTLYHQNKWYCMPEQAEKNRISLYEIDFHTHRLINEVVLLDNVRAFDPTLHYHEGKWWLFYALKTTGSNTALHIAYNEKLDKNFSLHENNPVKQDVRSSRPAGRMFESNGHLFRPSQDCSETYGGKIMVNKIVKLNTTEFREEFMHALFPLENQQGLHQIDRFGHRFTVDTKREKFVWKNFIHQITRRH